MYPASCSLPVSPQPKHLQPRSRLKWAQRRPRCTMFKDACWKVVFPAVAQPYNFLSATQTQLGCAQWLLLGQKIQSRLLDARKLLLWGVSRNACFRVCSWCAAASVQRLAKSSSVWNFSLGQLDVNFKQSHPPVYFCSPVLLLCPSISRPENFSLAE